MAVIYDLVILGSGPAGLGAAIYAQRADELYQGRTWRKRNF